MLACPARCCTYLGCMPRASRIVKQVCLRSCQRMEVSPARLSMSLKWRLIMFLASMGVLLPIANTRSESSQSVALSF